MTQVGTYTLSADLVAANQLVAHANGYALLIPGTHSVPVMFEGADIRQARIDGPYTLTQLRLLDLSAGGLPAAIADNVWVTGNYRWRDFGFDNIYLPVILNGH